MFIHETITLIASSLKYISLHIIFISGKTTFSDVNRFTQKVYLEFSFIIELQKNI